MKPKRAHELIYEVWGQSVRKRRTSLGLSQTALAKAMGIHQSTVSEVETGDYRAITPPLALRFAVALDCEPADLFGWPPGVGTIARYEAEAAA